MPLMRAGSQRRGFMLEAIGALPSSVWSNSWDDPRRIEDAADAQAVEGRRDQPDLEAQNCNGPPRPTLRVPKSRRSRGPALTPHQGAHKGRLTKSEGVSVHAQPPRQIECCAELGRYSRLTGSLHSPMPRNLACP